MGVFGNALKNYADRVSKMVKKKAIGEYPIAFWLYNLLYIVKNLKLVTLVTTWNLAILFINSVYIYNFDICFF